MRGENGGTWELSVGGGSRHFCLR